jgi:hypothetical protein
VGDEGGFAPNIGDNEEGLKLLQGAIEKAGYTGKVRSSSSSWMQACSNTSSACLAGRVLAYGCTQSCGHCMRGQ